ncbi:MAG TPA: helix-turn-helix domain-containing protein [Cytophagales bacterium]|nr:helix-turn-helix domain-containing protein [Cytophagales bacterium]
MPIRDTLDVVGGKWKLIIVQALFFHEKRRFKELQRDIEGITSRVLSAELKQLEINDLVKREVFNTAPPTVEYSLTEYGQSLKYVIAALYNWGAQHRERMLHGSDHILSSADMENVEGCTEGAETKAMFQAKKKKEKVLVGE